MTYSNTWSTTRPLGSAQASSIDDEIRALRLDIQERMNDLVVDWSADPVVLDQGPIGQVAGKQLVFGPHILASRQDENNVDHQDLYVDSDSDGDSLVGSLIVPTGVLITRVEAMMEFHSGASQCTTELFSYAFDATPGKSVLSTLTLSVSGIGFATENLNITTNGSRVYGIRFFTASGGRGRFYGLRLTYNTPDSRNTI